MATRLIFGSCPNCGADLPEAPKFCPECGSCEETGWSEDAVLDELQLPSESFDYREFIEREFGRRPAGLSWLWWLTAIGLLVAGALLFLAHIFAAVQRVSAADRQTRWRMFARPLPLGQAPHTASLPAL